MENKSYYYGNIAAGLIIWGTTAYNYTNVGSSIGMIGFALFFLWSLYRERSLNKFHVDPHIYYGLGIFFVSLFISSLFHLDNLKNINGGHYSVIGFILYTLPFWMIMYIGWKNDVRKSIFLVVSAAMYAMCIWGIAEYFLRHMSRLDSFYTSPTHVGVMLDMFLPFTVMLGVQYRKNRKYLIFIGILIILEFITLYLCETRGSFLALSVASILVLWVYLYKNGSIISKKVKNSIITIVGVAVFLSAVYSVSLGIGNSHRMWGEERFLMWESSYAMWDDHKLAGVGIDEWKASYEGPYRQAESKEVGINIMPHNMLLYFLSTSGIIGATGYILFSIIFLLYFLREIRRTPADPFSWGMLFIFISFTAHGMLDETIISKTMGRIYYGLLGASLIFIHWNKIDQDKDSSHDLRGI